MALPSLIDVVDSQLPREAREPGRPTPFAFQLTAREASLGTETATGS